MEHKAELFKLTKEGNISKLKLFFENHPDISVDEKNDQQETPLMVAINRKDDDVFNFLLHEKKANPNIDNGSPNYETAMHYAAENKKTTLVNAIMSVSFLTQAVIDRALVYYAEIGDEPKVNMCLEKGANVNATYLGNTCLMEAIINGHEDIALLLLNHNAIQVNLVNDMHEHALLLSLIHRREKISEKLLERNDIDLHLQGYLASTSLTYAIFSEQEKFIQCLIKKEMKNNKINSQYHPEAFNWAIKKNRMDIVTLFIESGSDVNQSGDNNHIARPDWVWQTISEVPYPISEAETERNELPLICAIKCHNEEAVKLLTKAGANPSKQNAYGETALEVSDDNVQLRGIVSNLSENRMKETRNPHYFLSTNAKYSATTIGKNSNELVSTTSDRLRINLISTLQNLNDELKLACILQFSEELNRIKENLEEKTSLSSVSPGITNT